MLIELKNVKYAAFASQETNCFSASIYIDGHKRGTVENSGHGGCDNIRPWQLGQEIEAYAKTLPEEDVSYLYDDGKVHTSPQSAEGLIGKLLEKWVEEKDLKRLCKTGVIFREPARGYKPGEYSKLLGTYSLDAARFLRGKYGEKVEIVNERFL
jgi:hypothetical protein